MDSPSCGKNKIRTRPGFALPMSNRKLIHLLCLMFLNTSILLAEDQNNQLRVDILIPSTTDLKNIPICTVFDLGIAINNETKVSQFARQLVVLRNEQPGDVDQKALDEFHEIQTAPTKDGKDALQAVLFVEKLSDKDFSMNLIETYGPSELAHTDVTEIKKNYLTIIPRTLSIVGAGEYTLTAGIKFHGSLIAKSAAIKIRLIDSGEIQLKK